MIVRYLRQKLVTVIGYIKQKIADVAGGSESERLTQRNNFTQLCHAYEILFSQRFGKIDESAERISLLYRLLGTSPPEAYFIVLYLAKTKSIEGGVCEFGVAQGRTSALIANEIKKSTKTLHLFDSFRGLPKPGPKDHLKNDIFHLGNIGAYTGKMSSPRRRIVHELSRIKFPKSRRVVHCGEIESLIARSKLLPRKVSFAYVDFDFYSPTRVTLEFLDTVTTVGSIVVVDDYDYFSTGVKSAVDEFLKKHRDYEILVANKGFGCFAVLKKISNNPKGYKEGSHG